jgi:putative transposase
VKTGDLCRQHGIREATFYNWKAKYGGLEVSDAQAPEGVGRREFQACKKVKRLAIKLSVWP